MYSCSFHRHTGSSVAPVARLPLSTIIIIFIILPVFILNANGFLLGGSGTTIRHNTQITHITQNNTPHSNKHITQNYTNNKGHTTHTECNANTVTAATGHRRSAGVSRAYSRAERVFIFEFRIETFCCYQ
jgi:hypothetical protein